MTRKQVFRATFWAVVSLLVTSIGVSGCGSIFSPESGTHSINTQCQAGLAQIQLADGFSRVLCGCQGIQNGEAVMPPTVLNCTVNAGSQVWFRFEASLMPHQILSKGTPSFPHGVLVDPELFPVPPVHSVTFGTPGIYGFEDAINPSIQGTITVL